MGRIVRLAGWAVCLVAAAVYVWRFFDVVSDPSVRAYFPLIVIEGLAFVGFGGIIIVLGRWLERGQVRHSIDGDTAKSRNRTLLVWLFRGQALVSMAAGALVGLWLTIFSTDSSSTDEITNYSGSMLMIFAACALVFGALPWWIGMRLKSGLGILPAALYSGVSLFVFPVGTVLGGVQLYLLHDISRKRAILEPVSE